MILTDYLLCEKSIQWNYARQLGISRAVIRLPEHKDFDVTNAGHWQRIYKSFTDEGLTPIVVEPMPNALHNPVKEGSAGRDEAIEKIIKMLPIMESLGISTICTNFMAHIGWLRTSSNIRERGDALVTGFDMKDFKPTGGVITHRQLWDNWEYFANAVIPHAEKHNVKIALHPDDPPVENLGKVARILTSLENMRRAVNTVKSPCLGVTMCQATFYAMGEDLEEVVTDLADKILFIHFRNIKGKKMKFNETFHDNGEIDMGKMVRLYERLCPNIPVRVDHVPTMAGEDNKIPGYESAGRLFAIGYLKGLIDNA